jgi:hypothetical protein
VCNIQTGANSATGWLTAITGAATSSGMFAIAGPPGIAAAVLLSGLQLGLYGVQANQEQQQCEQIEYQCININSC